MHGLHCHLTTTSLSTGLSPPTSSPTKVKKGVKEDAIIKNYNAVSLLARLADLSLTNCLLTLHDTSDITTSSEVAPNPTPTETVSFKALAALSAVRVTLSNKVYPVSKLEVSINARDLAFAAGCDLDDGGVCCDGVDREHLRGIFHTVGRGERENEGGVRGRR